MSYLENGMIAPCYNFTIDLFQRAWHLSVPSKTTKSIEIARNLSPKKLIMR